MIISKKDGFKKAMYLLIAGMISMSSVDAKTIRMACRAKGIELELAKKLFKEWTKKTGVDVEVIALPHASSECFAIYKQLISSGQCDIDVVAMDIAWISAFFDDLEILSSYNEISSDIIDDYFDIIKTTVTYKNKLIALSMYTDVGVLFYRKDLLEKYNCPVPKTFEDIYDIGIKIQNAERADGNRYIYGYTFSGKAAEGLMCVANEVITAYGSEFCKKNEISFKEQKLQQAVEFLVKCARDACPIGIANHNEEDSRGIFQIGSAVFMRNWPYAAVACNAPNLKGKVGITRLPIGTLGGWNLAIPKLSTNKKEAVSLLKFMTNKEAQELRAIEGHYAPAYRSLYNNPNVLEANPMFNLIAESLEHASCRPSSYFGSQYQKASALFVSFMNTAISNFDNKRYRLKKALKTICLRLNGLLKKNARHRTKTR